MQTDVPDNLDTNAVVAAITMDGQIAAMSGAITSFEKS